MSHTPSEAIDTILAASPRPAGSRLTRSVIVAFAEPAGEAAVEFDDPKLVTSYPRQIRRAWSHGNQDAVDTTGDPHYLAARPITPPFRAFDQVSRTSSPSPYQTRISHSISRVIPFLLHKGWGRSIWIIQLLLCGPALKVPPESPTRSRIPVRP